MKIDGREIAQQIYQRLATKVEELQKRNITPHLAVLLIGSDEGSISYIKQKKKFAEQIGAKVTVHSYDTTVSQAAIVSKVAELNTDTSVHGIIVQLPLPITFDTTSVVMSVTPQKDIDGFHNESPYEVPVALAVLKILEEIYNKSTTLQGGTLTQWLTTQNIALLGKGKTAGGPIKNYLEKLDVPFTLIDSHTENREELLKKAHIIITAVGKQVLTSAMVNEGVIIIGVGLHKGNDGKLHGDFDEQTLSPIVSFYTPTPGGVGPVNVAMLLENLVTAAEQTL